MIINDGCLRAGGFLLVWPYGFSLSADNGTFQVIDSTGKIVARVGDEIKVGGGADETPDGRVARVYSAQLPSERCSGPYWIVGEVITVENYTSPVATTPTLKYQVYAQANLTPGGTDGFYQATGWLGEKHVYLQGNRLEKIVFEQNATEEKELTIGESWELGEGYRLIANSISARDLAGRQSWLTLFKDSNTLVDIIMVQYGSGKIFTYQMNLSDSTPNFMIYCSRVDSLQYTDAAYFKYTWLRSQYIAKIREGDTFGVMEVISVKNGTIELRNKEPIDLAPGNAVHLMGDISIQVENSETGLLFYPIKWRR